VGDDVESVSLAWVVEQCSEYIYELLHLLFEYAFAAEFRYRLRFILEFDADATLVAGIFDETDHVFQELFVKAPLAICKSTSSWFSIVLVHCNTLTLHKTLLFYVEFL